jgi:protein-S-isoprenylcysteine O-methyltransferase
MILFQARPLSLIYLALFGAWLLGEVLLLVKQRATRGVASADRGFVGRALLVLLVSNLVAILALKFFRPMTFATNVSASVGLCLMSVGLILRWWSVTHLGRFFTVNVAVAADHLVVESGPYRWIRHPSYAGMLLVATGVGVCFGNVVSMLVILVPVLLLTLKRMRVEEEALATSLGDAYRSYMAHTKRLIPAIY